MSDIAKLQAVADAVRKEKEMRDGFREVLDLQLESMMEDYTAAVERAVMLALADEHTVTDVARAYTISGNTPNRNAIHAIKNKHAGEEDASIGDYPFRWVSREVETARGIKTKWDIYADLEDWGPDEISGSYAWRMDAVTGDLEPIILDTDADPYPTDTFYVQAIRRWIMMNPSPGGD